MAIKIRKLEEKEVTFLLEIEEEGRPVDGHFCDTEEPEKDRAMEAEIKERLLLGETWAWCTVKVTAVWKEMSGVDYLGCCSYKDEAEFTQEGGYYEGMKSEALDALNREIEKSFRRIRDLIAA